MGLLDKLRKDKGEDAPSQPVEKNQAYITLYTVIGDFKRVKQALVTQFSDVTKEVRLSEPNDNGDESFVIRFHDDTEIEFHINTNPEFVGPHIVGMHNFFAQVECSNRELHLSVLNQIRVFNCVVGSTFELDDNKERTNYIIDTMFSIAKDIEGFLLMPDMRLFSNNGKLVFSMEGNSEFEEYIPVGNADFLDQGRPEEAPADIARRKRSITILEEKGIPYIPHLRAAVMESEAKIRSTKEIAERLLAVFAVCVYSEVRNGGGTWNDAQKYPEEINKLMDGTLNNVLTPEEKEFLSVQKPESQELIKFGWRYECCHVLMWALGVLEQLGYPENICDVPNMAKILWGQDSMEDFIANTKPRSRDEILNAADLILRYDWACVDARINRRENASGLESGVVREWHYAFNWLIGANNSADWDNISTNT